MPTSAVLSHTEPFYQLHMESRLEPPRACDRYGTGWVSTHTGLDSGLLQRASAPSSLVLDADVSSNLEIQTALDCSVDTAVEGF